MVPQIKDAREPGAGELQLVPAAIGALRVEQVIDATLHGPLLRVAGPDGGTAAKPVGLTYIGIADRDGTEVRRLTFDGDREANREAGATAAIDDQTWPGMGRYAVALASALNWKDGKIQFFLKNGQYHHDRIWVAEQDGRILARAVWWGFPDGDRPLALDCLWVHPSVRDRVGLAEPCSWPAGHGRGPHSRRELR